MFLVLNTWLVCFVGGFICIPFLTLFERKILSYSQNRKGPNKVSLGGLLQPISDGLKLILKNLGSLSKSKKRIFWLSPFRRFCLMGFVFFCFPLIYGSFRLHLLILLFLCIVCLKVYSLLGSGIGSKSKYTLLGSIRGATQSISYEIRLITILFIPCFLSFSYNLNYFNNFFFFLIWTLFPLWLLIILAETNRAPFDFSEGERELVSGFNTEYGALPFALLFLAEYGYIIFFSVFSISLFLQKGGVFLELFVIFYFVWVRSRFPRFRYDFLMDLSWKVLLPFRFGLFFLYFFV